MSYVPAVQPLCYLSSRLAPVCQSLSCRGQKTRHSAPHAVSWVPIKEKESLPSPCGLQSC